MSTQGSEQSGHGLETDPHAGEPTNAASPCGDGVPPPDELELRVNEMQRQLQYATMVRANYEKQLHQLSSALQAERINKGERPAPCFCNDGAVFCHQPVWMCVSCAWSMCKRKCCGCWVGHGLHQVLTGANVQAKITCGCMNFRSKYTS